MTTTKPAPIPSPTGYSDEYVPAILSQWAAARELHARGTEEGVAWECYQGDCDHDDECPNRPFYVCDHCYKLAVEVDPELVPNWATWPCKTATALGGF